MERPDSSRTQALLAIRVGPAGGQDAVANAVVALCSEIEVALAPVVGSHGVAALFKRSLFLTGQVNPGLAGMHHAVESRMDCSALRARIETLPPDQATLVGVALLHTFQELLESLVGRSLTERLLSPLWDRPLSDPPALESTT